MTVTHPQPLPSTSSVVLHYRDDGPSGPCGQAVSTTAPWDRLLTYETEEDAVAYMRFLQSRRTHAGRLNPRIETYWFDEHVMAGPVVPEGERV